MANTFEDYNMIWNMDSKEKELWDIVWAISYEKQRWSSDANSYDVYLKSSIERAAEVASACADETITELRNRKKQEFKEEALKQNTKGSRGL